MDLHPDTEKRTEELENSLYDSMVCIVDAIRASQHQRPHVTPELEGWIEQARAACESWRGVLGETALRRIQRERRGGN